MNNAEKLARLERSLYNRTPLIGGILRLFAVENLKYAGTPSGIRLLSQAAIQTHHSQAKHTAINTLRSLRSLSAVDAACEAWAEMRHQTLADIMRERRWMPSTKAQDLRVLVALKTGRESLMLRDGTAIAVQLAKACDDVDAEISQAAAEVVRGAKRRKALQEALLDAVIENDCPTAAKLMMEQGFVPEDTAKRAAFLFLTEQWDRYEALDFDHRILRVFYEAASPKVRHRIVERLRVAGRTDFLAVVVGGERRSRADQLTPNESEMLVHTLAANREWARLWTMVFELPFYWSHRALRRLAENNWRPDDAENRGVFEELKSLLSERMADTEDRIRGLLPPAEPRAHASVPGRVNDLAFSSDRPVIAVGTGQRKLVLWNFHRGERENVLSGFDRSVGLVTCMENGGLLCAERTNGNAECAVYCWLDKEQTILGKHHGSVTALEPIGESLVLSAGRDHRVIIWDIDARRAVAEKQFDFWARSACIAPNSRFAVLLHSDTSAVNLPDLTPRSYRENAGSTRELRMARLAGIARCAAVSPESSSLLIGTGNSIVALDLDDDSYSPEVALLANHSGTVQGVRFLPNQDIVMTSGADRTLNFISWPARRVVAKVNIGSTERHIDSDGLQSVWEMPMPGRPEATGKSETEDRLTSMHISGDGSLMALGHSDGSISLWDLRLLNVPALINRPFAQATPDHLAGITMAMEYGRGNAELECTLRFMERILRFRFRHDIDLEDTPIIQAGEFDIEIEG